MTGLMPYAKTPLMRSIKRRMLTSMPGMITCEAFDKFLEDYFDDTLTKQQQRVFSRHLRLCPECVDFLEEYRKLRDLPRQSLDASLLDSLPDVPDDLVTAILDTRDKST